MSSTLKPTDESKLETNEIDHEYIEYQKERMGKKMDKYKELCDAVLEHYKTSMETNYNLKREVKAANQMLREAKR